MVKHLIQRHNNMSKVRVEARSYNQDLKTTPFIFLVTLLTKCQFFNNELNFIILLEKTLGLCSNCSNLLQEQVFQPKKNSKLWSRNSDYLKVKTIIKVINDASERASSLLTEFHDKLTRNSAKQNIFKIIKELREKQGTSVATSTERVTKKRNETILLKTINQMHIWCQSHRYLATLLYFLSATLLTN